MPDPRNHAPAAKPSPLAAFAFAAAIAFALAFLVACTPAQQAADEEKPPTASDYMVSMAKSSTQLSERLSDFAAAVAENDVSAVQAKADAAYEVIDQMDGLEAPDELKEVKDKYNEATKSLKDALKDYTALYLEIQNAPEGAPRDDAAYAQRIEAVQKEYDQGLNHLEEADEMASKL